MTGELGSFVRIYRQFGDDHVWQLVGQRKLPPHLLIISSNIANSSTDKIFNKNIH